MIYQKTGIRDQKQENQDPGSQSDPSGTIENRRTGKLETGILAGLQKIRKLRPGTLLSLKKNRKTKTQDPKDPSQTLENRKTGKTKSGNQVGLQKTGKPGSGMLVELWKNWNTRDPSGIPKNSEKQHMASCGALKNLKKLA